MNMNNAIHLKTKELDFIKAYLVHLNGVQAAIDIGYRPSTAQKIARKNLANYNVQRVIRLLGGKRVDAKRCGAHARSTGEPCQMKPVLGKTRCKLHGGLSSGAKTPEGKKRSAANGFKKGLRKEQINAIGQ